MQSKKLHLFCFKEICKHRLYSYPMIRVLNVAPSLNKSIMKEESKVS